jgi:hypothetical protein
LSFNDDIIHREKCGLKTIQNDEILGEYAKASLLSTFIFTGEAQMDKKLVWKELTSDGLLKEPADLRPYEESAESINNFGGFDSEEQAIEKLEQMKNDYEWDISSNYVLVTIYTP